MAHRVSDVWGGGEGDGGEVIGAGTEGQGHAEGAEVSGPEHEPQMEARPDPPKEDSNQHIIDAISGHQVTIQALSARLEKQERGYPPQGGWRTPSRTSWRRHAQQPNRIQLRPN